MLFILIVPAQSKHLAAIDNIYNQAIADGLRTADLHPLSDKERKDWFKIHSKVEYPIFVYTKQSAVLGWLSISPYRSGRGALNEVAEVSYYVDYAHHGEGIAGRLMERGIEFCKQTHFRILVAIMVSKNEGSIGLAKKYGFEESGRIKNAIHYKDLFRDHVYMSLELK